MAMIEIKNERLTAVLSTHGAELQSLRDQNGVERIWQGDPAFWTGHAPVLFPVAGALRGDAYTLDGVRYAMPKHGFSSGMDWQVEKQTADSVTFLLTQPHPGFPFQYELRARYVLCENQVQVEYAVRNLDTRDFCFSLGAHEAYAAPEGIEAYELVFDQAENFDHSLLEGSLITHRTVSLGQHTRVFQLRRADFETYDSLVFLNLASRGVTLQSPLHGRKIRVAYPDFDVLLLWTVPGAGYICIEPWRNAPDYTDADGDIRHKPGMIALRPGQERSLRHTLTIE